MTAELHDLITRALNDLEQGWPEAAYDALGRALRLLGETLHCAMTGAGRGTDTHTLGARDGA
ncbi:MAG TPA: hypothetical protein VFX20_13970 [Steroidobacteraceae bacterium]|nr:hypothetical protein [Steroidobacteraceae bacterium]